MYSVVSARASIARSLDLTAILLGFAAASGFADLLSKVGLFIWPVVPHNNIAGWPSDYVIMLLMSVVLWAVVSAYTGMHRTDRMESARYAYARLGRSLLLWLFGMAGATYFLKVNLVSRQFEISFFVISGGLIFLRLAIERGLSARRQKRLRHRRRVIVVGTEKDSQHFVELLNAQGDSYDTVSRVDLRYVKAALNGDNSDGSEPPAEVFIVSGCVAHPLVEEWLMQLLRSGTTVHIVPAFVDTSLFRRSMGDVAGIPTLTLETGNPHDLELIFKRAMDVIGAGIALILLSPLMIAIGILVRMTSGGPSLFSQERLGRAGKSFRMLKFRTMKRDAEKILKSDPELYRIYQENNFKLPKGKDPRVTPLGRVLRSLSLDELPQLVNVLRGEMSLVGPRPIVPQEIERYGEYGSLLLMAKPGITGKWQVNGRSNVAEYRQRVRMDLEYIRDQSVSGDVEILIRTIGAVARMDGAH